MRARFFNLVMKQRTPYLLSLIAIIAVVILSGCGSGGNDNNNQSTQQSTTPPTTSETQQSDQGSGPIPADALERLNQANSDLQEKGVGLSKQMMKCSQSASEQSDVMQCVTDLYEKDLLPLYDQLIPAYEDAANSASGQCKEDLTSYTDLMKNIRKDLQTILDAMKSQDQAKAQEAVSDMQKQISGSGVASASNLSKSCGLKLSSSSLPGAGG